MEELKRLTQEYKGKVEMICGFEDCMTDEDICPACNLSECACLQAVVEKLKSYEDAEEHKYKSDIENDLSKYDVDSLDELVTNVRNKAIDDFRTEICKMIVQSEKNGNFRFYAVEIKQSIADLAEQLKIGVTDDR